MTDTNLITFSNRTENLSIIILEFSTDVDRISWKQTLPPYLLKHLNYNIIKATKQFKIQWCQHCESGNFL